jgi:flagellar L-ring protein precursor FlgH
MTTISRLLTVCQILLVLHVASAHATIGLFHKTPKKTTTELRAEYLANVSQSVLSSSSRRTSGSLWSPDALMVEPAADYKAHTLNDIVIVVVSVQTTAAQSGSVDSERNFSTNSAITGMAGELSTKSTNPLLAASSSTTLKGSGSTHSSTAFSTSLTGQVIAVLPNGNLVIEAHRLIDMNNQHEDVIVRGIARPGDITPSNSVASSSLSALVLSHALSRFNNKSLYPGEPLCCPCACVRA